MKLLEIVHAALERRGIRHALIGAAALAIRGVGRSTVDLDVLVRDRACLQAATWADLERQGAAVSIREGDAEDPLAGVVRLDLAGARGVDVVVGRSAWQDGVLRRAMRVRLRSSDIPVVTAADLILLKLFAGGAQDLWDVQQLLGGSDRAAVIGAVDAEIGALPAACRKLWTDLLTG